MADIPKNRGHVRIAAAILAVIVVAAAVFTYLSYTAAFTSTDTVTVLSPRAGLVMDTDAKVKYRGIQVGKVKAIDYTGNEAKLTLAIRSATSRPTPRFASQARRSSERRRWSSSRPTSRSRRRCGPVPRCRPVTSSSR
jgi:phospholipid/cholesterol/gamma-HCH transport system substrate-binding protein